MPFLQDSSSFYTKHSHMCLACFRLAGSGIKPWIWLLLSHMSLLYHTALLVYTTRCLIHYKQFSKVSYLVPYIHIAHSLHSTYHYKSHSFPNILCSSPADCKLRHSKDLVWLVHHYGLNTYTCSAYCMYPIVIYQTNEHRCWAMFIRWLYLFLKITWLFINKKMFNS